MLTKILVALVLLLLSPTVIYSQESSWHIRDFTSKITVNEDTSISVQETIKTDFIFLEKHGIFRDIPYLYTFDGRSIKTYIDNISVVDEKGNEYEYESSRHNQSLQLKIGSPSYTVSDENTYVISYRLKGILQEYEGFPELYWNVTGNQWEVPILNATAEVNSAYAEIVEADCFRGELGSKEKCEFTTTVDKAKFSLRRRLTPGEGFTIVVKLSNENNLIFPTQIERALGWISSNYGYFLFPVPLVFIFFFWWKKGRDRSYISEIYYYKPDNKSERSAPIFPRISLPLAYSPINGLTPSEAGTLLDERVHIQDLIAEIVELARLGYIKIHKKTKKGLFKKDEYSLEKLVKDFEKLEPHQKMLLDSLFDGVIENEPVKIDSLSTKFYSALPKIKDEIYKQLQDKGLFNSNPEKTKAAWTSLYTVVNFAIGFLIFTNAITYTNFIPLVLQVLFFPIGLIFTLSMPRRTAWGYSLFQQTKGLREYIKLGQWRHDIAEKHLFLDEILPLAISLGVVSKLAKDMDELGVKPPSYMDGLSTGNVAATFAALNNTMARNISANPYGAGGFTTSGRSSWSGGSGFSSGGGFSGGGFGGGGGGSW